MSILIFLGIITLLLHLFNSYIPLNQPVKGVINIIVVVIALLVVALNLAGVIDIPAKLQ